MKFYSAVNSTNEAIKNDIAFYNRKPSENTEFFKVFEIDKNDMYYAGCRDEGEGDIFTISNKTLPNQYGKTI